MRGAVVPSVLPCSEIADLRFEARAWNRRMNRDGITIDWRFTRRKARLKSGYKRNQIMRPRY
jgi:hypothetical protein